MVLLMFELRGVDRIVRPDARVVIGRRRGSAAADIILRLFLLVPFPLIHLGRARDGDLIVEGEADVGILDRRLRGRRADHVNELVVVGGRGPRGFRLDNLACGILECDYGLNGSAFVPLTRRAPIKSRARELPNREPNPWLEVSVK